VENNRERSRIF